MAPVGEVKGLNNANTLVLLVSLSLKFIAGVKTIQRLVLAVLFFNNLEHFKISAEFL